MWNKKLKKCVDKAPHAKGKAKKAKPAPTAAPVNEEPAQTDEEAEGNAAEEAEPEE